MTRRARWHELRVNVAAHPVGWPLARLARRVCPVLHLPGFGVVVSDAAFAHEVLTRDATFTKNGPRSLAATMTRMLGPAALGNMDGDAHARLRGLLTDVVTPARAPDLLAACEAPLDALCDALAAGDTVDVTNTMRWMSGRVTFDMLGVVPVGTDDRAACVALVALGERIARGLDFRTPSAARLAQLDADCARLSAYAREGYDSAATPDRSFVRRLREAGLTFDEARGVIGLVFLAGTLTTAAALPRLLALLIDSGQFDALRRDASRIPAAVAEGLRYTTPVPATMRIAQEDATIRGRRIAAGTRMILLTCNMARDPELFADPDRFDAARPHAPRARHLWYGAGPHFCLGFAVAQRQLQLVLSRLAALDAPLRIVRRAAARGVIVPAYRRLEIQLARAPRS